MFKKGDLVRLTIMAINHNHHNYFPDHDDYVIKEIKLRTIPQKVECVPYDGYVDLERSGRRYSWEYELADKIDKEELDALELILSNYEKMKNIWKK